MCLKSAHFPCRAARAMFNRHQAVVWAVLAAVAAGGGAARARIPYIPESAAQQQRDYALALRARRWADGQTHAGTRPPPTGTNAACLAALRGHPAVTQVLRAMLLGTEEHAAALYMLGHRFRRFSGVSIGPSNPVGRLIFGSRKLVMDSAGILWKYFPEKVRPLAEFAAHARMAIGDSGSETCAMLFWSGLTPFHSQDVAIGLARCYTATAEGYPPVLITVFPPATQVRTVEWSDSAGAILPPGARRGYPKDIASWKAAASALKKAGSLDPLLHPKTPLLKYAAWVLNLRLAALKQKVNREWQAKLARIQNGMQQERQEMQRQRMLLTAQVVLQKRIKAFDALQIGPNSISKIMRLCGPASGAMARLEHAMAVNGSLPVVNGQHVFPPASLQNIPNYAALKKDFPHTDEAVVCNLYWKMFVLWNWKPVRNYLAAKHLNMNDPRVLYLDALVKSDETMKIEAVKELQAYLKKHPNHPSIRMLEQELSGTYILPHATR